ncbi:hypothetical protein HYH03_014976 [Edaphochlamys debaryana]|uniref:non-specific serine/threonine protein kinase n=1 Tax=Edaphochlamys debaryana TaxID=47281 RepID=A0A836BT18_9CHLO|nr:hypothetical protein HYH03_014976 [Edaphochlamys debaryana]|eukprot:KAG2486399.1 hypothetical protein HYH03_014976 [Edaphochlamys debaryana]
MDKYIRGKVLGKGSFGCAILVTNKLDNKNYVIKEIDISRMPKAERDAAEQEAKLLMALNHPNIVRCMECFTHLNKLCIVMDWCSEGDLYGLIQKRRGQQLSEDTILDWLVQMCLGLKHVHDRKILHRDIKTQNVFMSSGGLLKLGDFGVSKVLNSTFQLATTAVGTPYYLSPEICQNRKYNQKSDIWSLGCVLYELATLKHAFEAPNMRALIQKIIKGSYPPLPSTRSKELRDVCDRMLTLDWQKRPSINDILATPLMKARIQKFLSATLQAHEFSHTIIHGRPKPGQLVVGGGAAPQPPGAGAGPAPSVAAGVAAGLAPSKFAAPPSVVAAPSAAPAGRAPPAAAAGGFLGRPSPAAAAAGPGRPGAAAPAAAGVRHSGGNPGAAAAGARPGAAGVGARPAAGAVPGRAGVVGSAARPGVAAPSGAGAGGSPAAAVAGVGGAGAALRQAQEAAAAARAKAAEAAKQREDAVLALAAKRASDAEANAKRELDRARARELAALGAQREVERMRLEEARKKLEADRVRAESERRRREVARVDDERRAKAAEEARVRQSVEDARKQKEMESKRRKAEEEARKRDSERAAKEKEREDMRAKIAAQRREYQDRQAEAARNRAIAEQQLGRGPGGGEVQVFAGPKVPRRQWSPPRVEDRPLGAGEDNGGAGPREEAPERPARGGAGAGGGQGQGQGDYLSAEQRRAVWEEQKAAAERNRRAVQEGERHGGIAEFLGVPRGPPEPAPAPAERQGGSRPGSHQDRARPVPAAADISPDARRAAYLEMRAAAERNRAAVEGEQRGPAPSGAAGGGGRPATPPSGAAAGEAAGGGGLPRLSPRPSTSGGAPSPGPGSGAASPHAPAFVFGAGGGGGGGGGGGSPRVSGSGSDGVRLPGLSPGSGPGPSGLGPGSAAHPARPQHPPPPRSPPPRRPAPPPTPGSAARGPTPPNGAARRPITPPNGTPAAAAAGGRAATPPGGGRPPVPARPADPWAAKMARLEEERRKREAEILEFQRQHWQEVRDARERNRRQIMAEVRGEGPGESPARGPSPSGARPATPPSSSQQHQPGPRAASPGSAHTAAAAAAAAAAANGGGGGGGPRGGEEEEELDFAAMVKDMQDVLLQDGDGGRGGSEEDEDDIYNDEKHSAALAGQFVLNGQAVALPGVGARDSLALKVEALRVYLETALGTEPFLKVYRRLESLTLEDDEGAVSAEFLAVLGPERLPYLQLVHQLIVCEENMHSGAEY